MIASPPGSKYRISAVACTAFAAWLVLLFPSGNGTSRAQENVPTADSRALAELRQLGAQILTNAQSGHITELHLNHNPRLTDDVLVVVTNFPALTDLSLENTVVGDGGLASVGVLSKLQWLNLYQTDVRDYYPEDFTPRGLENWQRHRWFREF